LMVSGFTVWFDPEGGKNRAFGVRFPLGMQGQQPPIAFGARANPEEAEKLIQQQRELEIMRPGKEERQRMLLMQAQGIKAKLGNDQGFLVYELSVPLRESSDHPYAIGIDENRTIGIGFEASELNLDKMREQFGGTGRMGGPPGGSGSMPPGGGGPSGGRPPGVGPPGGKGIEPLKLWTRVELARGNTSAAK
jgi:hypothetical protein